MTSHQYRIDNCLYSHNIESNFIVWLIFYTVNYLLQSVDVSDSSSSCSTHSERNNNSIAYLATFTQKSLYRKQTKTSAAFGLGFRCGTLLYKFTNREQAASHIKVESSSLAIWLRKKSVHCLIICMNTS